MTFRRPSTNPTTSCRSGVPSSEASRRESLAHFPGARTTRRETWHDGILAGGRARTPIRIDS